MEQQVIDGPAFPVLQVSTVDREMTTHESLTGMSLRDYFAAKAMEALIAAAWGNPGPSNTAYAEWKRQQPIGSERLDYTDWIATHACKHADSMLVQLAKSST